MISKWLKKLNNKQIKELAKFCLDVSKMILGAWVFGIFFQENFRLLHAFLLFWGLLASGLSFIVGINLMKGVKND